MKKSILRLLRLKSTNSNAGKKKVPVLSRDAKIERGAKDFAQRFEGVMKDLANG